jgi:hypothetical protein
MLKREIEYEDFNGVKTTDVFYFNISKPELIELEVEYEQGFGKLLEDIVEAKNNKELVKQFKAIVLMAYGQKSEDGKRFIKSDQLREEFSQTAAYNALFMELATDDNAAVVFLQSVLPKDMVGDIDAAKLTALPSPPTPPTPPTLPNS